MIDQVNTYIQIIIHIMKMDIGQSKIETRLNFRCWVMFDNLVLLICDGQAEWRICLFGSKCVSSVSWKCRRLFELYNSIDPWLPLHPIQTWYFELKGNNGLSSESKQKWQTQNKSDQLTAIWAFQLNWPLAGSAEILHPDLVIWAEKIKMPNSKLSQWN